ncbi:MAG TPA: adenylate/guanylate cyclase domain-containing protein, partial [Terrimicrobiaceae bacterium]|nr:adenylate/guanylate cyclase domain-containing protein [Terrimicrobiaceae bacterium]
EFGLRRRLAFERWFGALNAPTPNQEIIAEAKKNYDTFTTNLASEIAIARGLIASYTGQMASRPLLVEVRTLLDQIEPAYPLIGARQREVLDLQMSGQRDKANQVLNLLNDLQRTVQNQRELLQRKMTQLSNASAQDVKQRQRYVLWLTIAATISTVLLGLVVAALITERLTEPVRSLASAIRDVQKGNLNVQLPVRSADEVGALTDSFNFFVQELRAKEQIKQTFGKYIDPRILDRVLLQPGATSVASGRQRMTILFADLVGFTGLSERLTGSLMVTLLNRHFGLQALAIQEHQGVVDKFIGDSVMAFWGPPFTRAEDHALLACQAAWGQLAALDALRRELPELTGLRKDAPAIDLGVGVCTGEVVVGNIGSENIRSYTVIGDTVNLAARIERANRTYGTKILLSETTAQTLSPHFETREIDTIAVKGKTESTRIFELLGPTGEISDDSLLLRELYGQALLAYRTQDWEAAATGFQKCLELRSNDGPSALFLKRLQTLRLNAPPADWSSVAQLDGK